MILVVVLHFRKLEGTDAGTETDINLFQELYYHYLGTDQSEDILCWRDLEHATWLSSARISDDGQVGFEWHFDLPWYILS